MRSITSGLMVMATTSGSTLILAVARSKVISVYVGVEAIGLLGALSSFVILATAVLGLGISLVGVRSVASTPSGSPERAQTIWSLRRGSVFLALVAALSLGAMSIVAKAFGALPISTFNSLMLAVGVGATIASGARVAILNGSGRLGAVAVATTAGAGAGTVVTVAAALLAPTLAVGCAVCFAPVFTLLVAVLLDRDGGLVRPSGTSWRAPFLRIVALGTTVTLGTAISAGSQFGVRSWVGRTGGLADLGQLQAAWVIGATYLGFVLTAFAAEYFPRISAQAQDLPTLNRLVDFQVRLAVVLCLPVILMTQAFSRLVVTLFYSDEFVASSDILLMQLPGDIFKIFGWAIAFALLALHDSIGYLVLECVWAVAYAVLAVALLPLGIVYLGAAYAGSYLVYSAYAVARMRRTTGYRPSRATILAVTGASGLTLLGATSATVSWVPVYTMVVLAAATAVLACILMVRWTKSGALSGQPHHES